MKQTLIHSTRLVSDRRIISPGWVLLSGPTISAVGTGVPPTQVNGDIVNAGGRFLTPGFVDIHGHGGAQASFGDDEGSTLRALRLHRAHGTTRSVLSLVTAPIDRLERQLDLIAGLTAADPCVLGSHLEGPFLSSAHKGAHQESLLRAPDHRMIDRLLNAARGSIRQITLAPELPGGMDALHQLTAAGVPVAVGHTDATYEKTREAFEAGATILTHAFSGMNSLHHRAPGPVLAAIRSPAVTLEVINDGVHLHPEIVRLAFDEAPNRIALITDAMAGTGAPDGTYLLGTLEVAVRSGIARLAGGNQIAGSTLTLDVAVANAVRNVGLSFEDAIAAVTEVPARAIGRGHDLGRLAPGYAADAVLMSDEFEVQSVWANGIRIPTGRGLSPAA